MKILSAVIAATVLSAIPGVAAADTPAPKPSLGPDQIADAPLKVSKHAISGTSADWGLDWFDLSFRATTKNATLQFSKQAPTQNKQGVYSMGAAQPVALTGEGGGNPDDLVLPGQQYDFSQRVAGLDQGTTYHFLITLPVGAGFKPVQVTGSIRTEHHSEHTITRRLSGLDLEFTASNPSAFVSVSTSPEISGEKLKGSTAVAVQGQPADGGFRFTHSFQKLTPGTTYYVFTTAGSSKPTQRLTKTSTKAQQVEISVEKIVVHDDADNGLRGKGELLFQVRGTDAPSKSGLWGTHYGETKIGSGDSVNVAGSPKAPRHTVTTQHDSLTVQVEGRESDALTKTARQFCEKHYNQPHEKHRARWLNEEDSGADCYQFSFAETSFDLRKGNVQTKTFSVARSPELRFSVTVKMIVTAV